MSAAERQSEVNNTTPCRPATSAAIHRCARSTRIHECSAPSRKCCTTSRRFSSARQLYLHLVDEMFQLPVVKHGRDWREVEWITPSYSQILELVRNPAYAGVYVRGRTKAITTLDSDGHKQTKRRRVPREEWDVFLEDHHDAYITPEAWERNVEKIDANANVRGPLAKGAVGRGCSIMAGLLRCRRCGHRLQARYSSGGVRYVCSAAIDNGRAVPRAARPFPAPGWSHCSRKRFSRWSGPRASKRRNAPRSGWRCAIKSNGNCSLIVCRPPSKLSSARARIQANRCHLRGSAASVGSRMGDRAGPRGGGAVAPDRVR